MPRFAAEARIPLSGDAPVRLNAGVFDAIVDLVSGSSWTYAVVFGVSLLDAFFPIVPSETTVIAAGVVAAGGGLEIWLIVLAAAAGAIAGDNVAYFLGRTVGEHISGWLFRGKRKRHVERAHRLLEERGGYIIIVARFIPMGRTAVTFSCGLLAWEWRRFIVFDVIAGFVWATYATLLGYFGGKAFEEEPLKGFALAFAAAIGIAAAIELVRWYRRRAPQET